jgi:hypothetical protein
MPSPPSYDAVCDLLRKHREEMRVVAAFIEDYDLEEELEACVIEATGNTGFYLGADNPDLDPDGGEAPETRAWKAKAVELLSTKAQVCAQERFIQATLGLAQQKSLEEALSRTRLDLDRARMRGEDKRVF